MLVKGFSNRCWKKRGDRVLENWLKEKKGGLRSEQPPPYKIWGIAPCVCQTLQAEVMILGEWTDFFHPFHFISFFPASFLQLCEAVMESIDCLPLHHFTKLFCHVLLCYFYLSIHRNSPSLKLAVSFIVVCFVSFIFTHPCSDLASSSFISSFFPSPTVSLDCRIGGDGLVLTHRIPDTWTE